MANEIHHNYATGDTLYFCTFQPNGDVFLTGGASDEVWGTGARTAADYDEAMTENAPDGHFVGTFTVAVAGTYQVTVYLQVGGSPADSDLAIAQGEIYWDGTAEINTFTLDASINDDIIGNDGDTLESLSDQMDVLSAQKSQVLNVYDT